MNTSTNTSTNSSTRHHAIAIIGAGLAGLMLARVLQVNDIRADVYDADVSANANPQGGMLDIHHDSGQLALQAAGVFEEFTKLIHVGGEEMRIYDKRAQLRVHNHGGGGRPEVSRGPLRALLVQSLPPERIHWSSKTVAVETLASGVHSVTFADGRSITADILIGADGAWSKVRSLVSNAKPQYTGISFLEMHVSDVQTGHPDIASLVGGGVMFALSDEQGLIVHRDPDDRLHAYAAIKSADESRHESVRTNNRTEAMRSALLQRFADWDNRLAGIIAHADDAIVSRAIYELPVGHRWDRVPGVTLIGDAAHLMSPFAGEGANLALFDGAQLARAIVDNPEDIERAITRYEIAMFERSAISARESHDNLAIAFREDAPQGMVDLMESYQRMGSEQ